MPPDAYPPIGDYALIGNCRTAALVSRQGSIDWLCLPDFASESVFGALLDAGRGGRFRVCPRDIQSIERRYIDRTNVLETTFHCAAGVLRLTDFMTINGIEEPLGFEPQHELARVADCVSGMVVVDAYYQPRPAYGAKTAKLVRCGELGWTFTHQGLVTYLQTDLSLHKHPDGSLQGERPLQAGECAEFSLAVMHNDVAVLPAGGAALRARMRQTVDWWRDWLSQCTYEGPFRAAVLRSCLAIKLLTYCLSGAVVAAPTTSVPAGRSGTRTWDYRYCWLRDSSIALACFIDLGFDRESRAYLEWLLHATRLTQPALQVMYDIYGETALREQELGHLHGHGGARPVRIGNGAYRQLQLDVYGEVMTTAFRCAERGGRFDHYERKLLCGFGQVVREHWRQPDNGIWEVRGPPRHHTHSKVMCWATLDRLLRLNGAHELGLDVTAVSAVRDEIRADIERNGFDAELNSYVAYYGSREPDAALLLLPRYGYIDANDPHMEGTCRYIESKLAANGLLYRYPPDGGYDGVDGQDDAFTLCGFWLVDYLVRAGSTERAARVFERLLEVANDLGLYAEESDPHSGRQTGNFPLAFTHVELIAAAMCLERAQACSREAIAA